jgi:hypothetical protein
VSLAAARRNVCRKYGCEYTPVLGPEAAGVALSTLGMTPVNGLRHPMSAGTTGWYIWCGENLSDAADYFAPLCVDDLLKKLPVVSDLLGLPPGFRFLIAEGHLDVWYDVGLLNV